MRTTICKSDLQSRVCDTNIGYGPRLTPCSTQSHMAGQTTPVSRCAFINDQCYSTRVTTHFYHFFGFGPFLRTQTCASCTWSAQSGSRLANILSYILGLATCFALLGLTFVCQYIDYRPLHSERRSIHVGRAPPSTRLDYDTTPFLAWGSRLMFHKPYMLLPRFHGSSSFGIKNRRHFR